MLRGFITTVNGEEIPVSIGQGGVNFDGKAPVTVRDVVTLNGIIHFLDKTLAQAPAPPSGDVVQVFVTRGQTYPTSYTDGFDTLDGLAGADFYCQDQVEDAGLTGTWTAWMSDDGNDAIDRIPPGRYELVNGELVAEDKADLIDGFLETGIHLDQFGGVQKALVWTGTNKDGTRAADNCSNWTDGNAPALHGYASADTTYPDWTETTVTGCNQGDFHLYCFGGGE